MICTISLAGRRAVLTSDHAASSYGLPVLVIDGQAYGPGDVLPWGDLARDWLGATRSYALGLGPEAWFADVETLAAAFLGIRSAFPAPDHDLF